MNRSDRDLIKTRLTDDSQIVCGMLVSFVVGKDPQDGRNLLSRGFIRSINKGVATITAGRGTYQLPATTKMIRYELTRD